MPRVVPVPVFFAPPLKPEPLPPILLSKLAIIVATAAPAATLNGNGKLFIVLITAPTLSISASAIVAAILVAEVAK